MIKISWAFLDSISFYLSLTLSFSPSAGHRLLSHVSAQRSSGARSKMWCHEATCDRKWELLPVRCVCALACRASVTSNVKNNHKPNWGWPQIINIVSQFHTASVWTKQIKYKLHSNMVSRYDLNNLQNIRDNSRSLHMPSKHAGEEAVPGRKYTAFHTWGRRNVRIEIDLKSSLA